MDIDPDTLTVRVDWHGYGLDQVETWADRIVEAAWANGFEYVEFVHGAPDIATRGSFGWKGGPAAGPGHDQAAPAQTALRKPLAPLGTERREGMHRVEDGRMLIALRDNPPPSRQAKWPLVPPPLHGNPR